MSLCFKYSTLAASVVVVTAILPHPRSVWAEQGQRDLDPAFNESTTSPAIAVAEQPGAPLASLAGGCLASSPPQHDPGLPDAGFGRAQRYLGFVGGDAGRQQAVRVTFVDLNVGGTLFEEFIGESMWVGQPREVCENSAQATPPAQGCAEGHPTSLFNAATLQCDPFFMDWSVIGPVRVSHELIVPTGRFSEEPTTYEIQIIDDSCSLDDEANYSAGLTVTQPRWGDLSGRCCDPSPPDDEFNVFDLLQVVEKFMNVPMDLVTARGDLAPATPDQLITIADVVVSRNASKAFGYPYVPPQGLCADCGNGLREAGEECDDGNTDPGDGCDNACQLELQPEPGDVVMALLPVSNFADGSLSPGVAIVGNEMQLPAGGKQVFLEIRLANWGQGGFGDFFDWQAIVDSAGYATGLQGTLAPHVVDCSADASLCETQLGPASRCDALGQPPGVCAVAFFDRDREDYVYNIPPAIFSLPFVDVTIPDYRFGATSPSYFGVGDIGISAYAATLVLHVPEDAAGTFTIGFQSDPEATLMTDGGDGPGLPLAPLQPAVITVGTPCCLPDGSCHGMAGQAECAGGGGTVVVTCASVVDDSVLDPCECAIASTPVTDRIGQEVSTKNRYLSIDVSDPRFQAIRVTFVALPPPWDAWNDTQMWVQEPQEVCENSGQGPDVNAPQDCGPAGGADLTFKWAGLGCHPVFRDWRADGVVHVSHEGIVPSTLEFTARYDVQVIEQTCDRKDEGNYSDPLQLTTSKWGDICGPGPGGVCTGAADGNPEMIQDVLGLIDKFQNINALQKSRADLVSSEVDLKVTIIGDALFALDAFQGFPYPFTPGDPCGPG